jgi:putative membrane protein
LFLARVVCGFGRGRLPCDAETIGHAHLALPLRLVGYYHGNHRLSSFTVMIIRPQLRWFRMLLAWRGSVLPELLPRLCVILLISLVALGVHVHLLKISINMTTTPFSLIGIALAIFLGFRNSASYGASCSTRRARSRARC